jgi:hypothetical protein
MRAQHLKVISLLSVVFWAALLIHIYWMFAQPLPDDDRIRQFAERYRITSSLELFVIVAVGITFSLLSWLRRAGWAALVVACLAAFTFWRMYLQGLPYFFRPPLGDGTFERAFAVWWRLHSPMLAWHIVKAVLLILSAVTWTFVYVRLSREQKVHVV